MATDAGRTMGMATVRSDTDPLTIAGRTLRSRLLLGTGGFPSLALLAESIRASAARSW